MKTNAPINFKTMRMFHKEKINIIIKVNQTENWLIGMNNEIKQ